MKTAINLNTSVFYRPNIFINIIFISTEHFSDSILLNYIFLLIQLHTLRGLNEILMHFQIKYE